VTLLLSLIIGLLAVRGGHPGDETGELGQGRLQFPGRELGYQLVRRRG
jgi:hypothetical protein